jgi:hypothetical protein
MNQFPPSSRPGVDSTTVLVLGILSWMLCPCFGVFAWAMGNAALTQLDDRGIYDGSDRTSVQIGRVLGIVSTILLLAPLALGTFALAVAWLASVGAFGR